VEERAHEPECQRAQGEQGSTDGGRDHRSVELRPIPMRRRRDHSAAQTSQPSHYEEDHPREGRHPQSIPQEEPAESAAQVAQKHPPADVGLGKDAMVESAQHPARREDTEDPTRRQDGDKHPRCADHRGRLREPADGAHRPSDEPSAGLHVMPGTHHHQTHEKNDKWQNPQYRPHHLDAGDPERETRLLTQKAQAGAVGQTHRFQGLPVGERNVLVPLPNDQRCPVLTEKFLFRPVHGTNLPRNAPNRTD
jgi:hypothetical protein